MSIFEEYGAFKAYLKDTLWVKVLFSNIFYIAIELYSNLECEIIQTLQGFYL